MNVKEIITLISEFLKIVRVVYSELQKQKNKGELKDVRKAVEKLDLNKLRNSILGRK